ncbi:MAG: hypothetical protein ABIZ18_07560 [Caldimonas sp.]
MSITDAELARVIALVTRDVDYTISVRMRAVVPETIDEVRDSYGWNGERDLATLTEKYVEDVQQCFMDCHIDTTWPACRRHPNHPLWFHDDAWHCDRDGVPLARLGELDSILPPRPRDPPFTPGRFIRRPKAS